MIYIDVNRFKSVNDKYGHKIGDLYLKQISARLMHQLRPDRSLARLCGDEFNVILPCPENFDRVHSVTSRLKACFDDPFYLYFPLVTGFGKLWFFAISAGWRHCRGTKTCVADHAMYMCKHDANIAREARAVPLSLLPMSWGSP